MKLLAKSCTTKETKFVGIGRFDEAAESKDFRALVDAGRHRNVHLMVCDTIHSE